MTTKLSAAQLAKMTKEQKLALIDALDEKKRRARNTLEVFSPNAGQLPVHLSKKDLRCVFSGNGAGKTAMAVNEVKWMAEGYNPITKEHTPVPAKIFVVLDSPGKVEQTWLPELKKWMNLKPDQLHKRGKPYVSALSFPNGSQVTFLFHEQEPMSFESIEGQFFVFDEPSPRHIFVALRRGGRTKGRQARYLMIGTPIAAPWLRTEIYEAWARGESPDTECFRFGTRVNQANLTEGYIDKFGAILTEKEKRIRLEGEFFDLDGLALAHLFRRDTHVLRRDEYEWDISNPCVVAIDCHGAKPHVALLVGADSNGPVVLKELSAKATPRDFARMLKEWYRGYRLVDIVCDSLGSADMTGGEAFKSFIQVLKDEGIRVRATTYADKSDEAWIARIQNVLQVPKEADNFGQMIPKLRILDGVPGIVSDIESVSWLKFRNADVFKPTLDISKKDYLACLKYALSTNLTQSKGKEVAYSFKKPVYGFSLRR
jgi:hypothetical protein